MRKQLIKQELDDRIKSKYDLILFVISVFTDITKRSINSKNECIYKSENNNRCAVGILLTEECIDSILEKGLNHSSLYSLIDKIQLQTKFKLNSTEKEKNILYLYCLLQDLHDSERHFIEEPQKLNDFVHYYSNFAFKKFKDILKEFCNIHLSGKKILIKAMEMFPENKLKLIKNK